MELLPSLIGPVIGGLLGGSEGAKGQQQTSQNTIDPRIAKYLYGENGSTGLMGNTSDLYQKQLAQGGLNPMQNAGLEMQRQAYTDPRYGQSFNSMRDVGMGLMGGGMAGNPFNQGGRMGPAQNMGFGGTPSQPSPSSATSAAYQPIAQAPAYQAPAPAPQAVAPVDFQQMMQDYLKQNNYQQFAPDRGEAGGGR